MTTHDYTKNRRRWGHDYVIFEVEKGGKILKTSGWGHGIKKGDAILFDNKDARPPENPTTRYKVKEIEYLSNPPDMWRATLEFFPRT
jgi:hypothetical protein